MNTLIKTAIDDLIEETTKFDFPFLSSAEKKKKIVNDNKKYVEKQLEKIAGSNYPVQEIVDKIWKESIEYTEKQFATLSESNRLNGFYLQELMHYYVEQLGKIILMDK